VKSETKFPEWYSFTEDGGKNNLLLLDSRGCGESTEDFLSESTIGDSFVVVEKFTPFDSLKLALNKTSPDAILFLCKARDVRYADGLNKDLNFLADTIHFIESRWQVSPPVIPILSQIDELDPVSDYIPSKYSETKKKNIEEAKCDFERAMKRASKKGISVEKTFAVSSRVIWKEDKIEEDCRFNVDELVQYISETISLSTRLQMLQVFNQKKLIVVFLRRWLQHLVDITLEVSEDCPYKSLSQLYGTMFTLIASFVASVMAGGSFERVNTFLKEVFENCFLIWDQKHHANLYLIGGKFFTWKWKTIHVSDILKQLGETAILYFGSESESERENSKKVFSENLWKDLLLQ